MTQEKNSWLRTVIFMAILLPVIAWLVMFSIKKNNESAQRSQQCQDECTKSGKSGYEFSWNVLSGPVCKCLE